MKKECRHPIEMQMEEARAVPEASPAEMQQHPADQQPWAGAVFQSMQTYILRHYKRKILAEISRQMEGGTLRTLTEAADHPRRLRAAQCRFGEMSFWRVNAHTVLADVPVSIGMPEGENKRIFEINCELWLDMEKGPELTFGECALQAEKTDRNGWMLSQYLVPILRRDEVEQGAEALLLRFCPHALTDSRARDAYVLADRMGLRVMRCPLYRQHRTRSILFFRPGMLTTERLDANGCGTGIADEIEIPGNTIVLNSHAVHKDCCQLDIYHECIHYDWHYLFFRLQELESGNTQGKKCSRSAARQSADAANPVRWMEWQARRGSFGLMMPLGLMTPLVASLWAKQAEGTKHPGQRYDEIARAIARELELPKFRVRARLLQMGHIAAKGALNYVDGRYIEPFAFSEGNGGGNSSFVIGRRQVFDLYRENETFRTQLHGGGYIYADGHLCLYDSRFVRSTEAGPRLNAWANAHVDQCCLRFVNCYEVCDALDYCAGKLHSDEEYNRHYMAFPRPDDRLNSRESLSAMNRLIGELPLTFHDALTYLMKRAQLSIEALESKAGISGRTITRLRNQERRDYSLDQVIALCVALQLPPWLSREMLARAGFVLRPTKQHQAYQLVLDCMFMDRLEDVQRFLAEAECEPLRLGSLEPS